MHRGRNGVIIEQFSGASAVSLLRDGREALVVAVATPIALRDDNKFGRLPLAHSLSDDSQRDKARQ